MKKQRLILILSVLLILLAAALSDAAEIDSDIAKVATEYKLDPVLFNAIIAHESNFELDAYNHKTQDFGLTQINIKTARAYKFDTKKLQTDKLYSLRAGAKVLHDFKLRYAKRESLTWFCRYNVGTRQYETVKKNCLKYIRDVVRYY